MKKLFAALIFLLLLAGRAGAAFYANYFTTNANPVAGGGIVGSTNFTFNIFGVGNDLYTNSTPYGAFVTATAVMSGSNQVSCMVTNPDLTLFKHTPYNFPLNQFSGNAVSNSWQFYVPPYGIYRVFTNGLLSASAVGRERLITYIATNGASGSGGGGSGTTYTNDTGLPGAVNGSSIGTNLASLMIKTNPVGYFGSTYELSTNRIPYWQGASYVNSSYTFFDSWNNGILTVFAKINGAGGYDYYWGSLTNQAQVFQVSDTPRDGNEPRVGFNYNYDSGDFEGDLHYQWVWRTNSGLYYIGELSTFFNYIRYRASDGDFSFGVSNQSLTLTATNVIGTNYTGYGTTTLADLNVTGTMTGGVVRAVSYVASGTYIGNAAMLTNVPGTSITGALTNNTTGNAATATLATTAIGSTNFYGSRSPGEYGMWHGAKIPGGRALALDRLIFDLKQNNLWSNIVFMQVYGTGYQDTSNTISLRGPRPFTSRVGTNYNFGYSIRSQGNNGYVQMASTVSNVTLVVAMSGTADTDSGTQTFLLGVQSTDTFGWDSQVSIQKSSGGILTGQSVGDSGGAQQFYYPQSGLEAVYTVSPKTLMFALDTSANTGLWVVNGVANTNTSYTHGDPLAMKNINWGLGNEFGGDYICKGNYACRIIYNVALTSAQMTTLDAIIKRTLMPQNKIVFYGDSLFTLTVSGITEWENIFQSSDFSLSGYPSSVAHAGDSLSDMTNLWPAQLITNIVSVNNVERQIAFLRIGANDIGNYTSVQRSATAISDGIRYFWRVARTNGCEVVGCGILRRDNNRNTDVQTINATLRTAYANGECDYFIDFDTVWTEAVGEGYWTNATYFSNQPSNQVHPDTAAGRAVELQAILPLARQIFP